MTTSLRVERAAFAHIQDLGRPGFAAIGVGANGAGDQQSARLANALVGNAGSAPLIEVVASQFEATARGDLLVAVCGAVAEVGIDGYRWPAGQPIAVPAGARISLPAPEHGVRSYLAVNGQIAAERALGSVAPDPLLGFGRALHPGDQIDVDTQFHASDVLSMPLFRVAAPAVRLSPRVALRATRGPDLYRLAGGESALDAQFEVTPQSDYIGVRLVGGDLALGVRDEILSRGVPIGAVEVPPSGELIMLMRGRLVTAGYPVVAVLTRGSIDRLAQARPGNAVTVTLVDHAEAQRELEHADSQVRDTAVRAATALRARGLDRLVAADHASHA